MAKSVAIVGSGVWLPAVSEQIAAAGLRPEPVRELSPSRSDTVCTIAAFESLAEVDITRLGQTLRAGQWARPCVLAVERPLGAECSGLLRAGLEHIVGLGERGALLPAAFRQTLLRLEGHPRANLGAYLDSKRVTQSHRVIQSSDKGAVVTAVGSLAQRRGVSTRMADTLRTAADELVTNALYNAPTDAAGRHRFASLSRSVAVELDANELVEFAVGIDSRLVALRVTDPFGSFDPEQLFSVLARGLTVTGVERKSGGAGLGLGWVFAHAAHLLITIEIGRSTEIVALFDVTTSHRARARLPHTVDIFIDRVRAEAPQPRYFFESAT